MFQVTLQLVPNSRPTAEQIVAYLKNGTNDSYNFHRISPNPLNKHVEEWMLIESQYQSVLTQIEDLLGKKDEAGMPESCGMNELGSMIEKTTVCHNKIGDFVAKLSGVCEPDPECEEEELD